MKLIEFICNYGEDDNVNFSPMMIDILDISTIIRKNDFLSILTTKNKETFQVWGSYRSIQSRIVYGLMLKQRLFEDSTLRPSITILYNLSKLEVDNIHMDDVQCLAFLMAYNSMDKIEKIDEYSAELIMNAKTRIEDKFLTK